jgi:hypothetical protein
MTFKFRIAESLRLCTRRSSKHVWARVLDHLETSELKTARLVCGTSRMESVPFIKSLPFERCPNSEESLRECLQKFPFVTSIALSIQLPQQANLIGLPEMSTQLCKLRLSFPPDLRGIPRWAPVDALNRSLDDMIPILRLAAHLTSLELTNWPRIRIEDHIPQNLVQELRTTLVRVLNACWRLQDLKLDVDSWNFGAHW